MLSSQHWFCHSAGILLSPPAEAQHWEDNTRDDTTEQRGRRWESDIAKQSQGKAREQSETSIKVQEWEQTWEDPGRWSFHCEPSQRSSQGNSRWTNHTCSCVHIHASCADWWIIFTVQHGHLYFMICVKLWLRNIRKKLTMCWCSAIYCNMKKNRNSPDNLNSSIWK